MKRVAALLIVGCLIASFLGLSAYADSSIIKTTSGEFQILDDDSLEITSIKITDSVYYLVNAYTVPSEVSGHSVSSISGLALDIWTYKIIIPDEITSIEYNPVKNTSLAFFEVRPTHPTLAEIDGVLFGKADKRLICYPPNKEGTIYEIPEGITTIGKYAFRNNQNLEEIIIPDSVTTIDSYAFYGCENLRKIVIPDSVSVLSDHVFCGCESLEICSIPENVTYIGDSAFSGCTSLESCSIPENVTYIGDSAFFGCTSLKSLSLPDCLETVGINPFSKCTKLAVIEISSDNCALKIENNVVFSRDGSRLLFSMNTTSNYVIPDGVQIIDRFAFYQGTQTEIVIPSSVIEIGASAFSNSKLNSITLPENIQIIGNRAFENCFISPLYLPKSLTYIADDFFDGKHYPSGFAFIVEPDTYGEQYAKGSGIPYRYNDEGSLDWLG